MSDGKEFNVKVLGFGVIGFVDVGDSDSQRVDIPVLLPFPSDVDRVAHYLTRPFSCFAVTLHRMVKQVDLPTGKPNEMRRKNIFECWQVSSEDAALLLYGYCQHFEPLAGAKDDFTRMFPVAAMQAVARLQA